MTQYINPKTFVPRSLEVSKLEQAKKVRPEVQQEQLTKNLQQKNTKKKNRVNQSEKTAGKAIKREKEESTSNQNSQDQEEDEDNQSKASKQRGNYIDIKV